MKKVSILMLTYNAPRYVKKSIVSLKKLTSNQNYELIVVDNDSKHPTVRTLYKLKSRGLVDKLYYNSNNDLFAKGNNIAARLASEDSDYYLLLNSDVEIKSPDWLDKLIELMPEEGGIASFGAVQSAPKRADGYCMMINADLYNKYKLDEHFQWWWGVTKLESQVLKEGKKVIAVDDHEEYIHHFGGKSGKGFSDATGMDVDMDEVKKWFADGDVKIIPHL
ncbi:glycosyltransferase [Lactobacillus johnsonii]|uniref:glycosyltransferase family 2 protein n=1 Tax=Lactobacillus johnsonii TaxID=33959 RepID=UPI001CBEA79B|nr:glycosyltransferase [Lactobacillus johnsonii]MBZ4027798.1 glycosyltransferase [Lactobacillus johnsonii]